LADNGRRREALSRNELINALLSSADFCRCANEKIFHVVDTPARILHSERVDDHIDIFSSSGVKSGLNECNKFFNWLNMRYKKIIHYNKISL